jgi:YjjG family noncanonical pyrimidine nucleotidase
MPKYELVLLDADETLFDFKRVEGYALERSFGQFGLELTEDVLRDYDTINKSLWRRLEKGETSQAKLKIERFRLLFQKLGASVDAEDFSRSYIEWLSKGSFLLEGAESLCKYLYGKYRLAILSNGIKDVQLPRINASPLLKYLTGIIVSEEAKSSKPDAGIFEYACASLGFFDKRRMLMVGDSLSSDIQGGINFGIDTLWVNMAKTENETGPRPTYEVHSLAEIRGIL